MKFSPLGSHAALVAAIALAVLVAPSAFASPVVPAAGTVARVAPGAEIAFDDLPAYVGSEIVVSTKVGTVRRAELTGASSISINLKLVPAEGGFAMSMPREHVAKVELAPVADEAKN